MSLKEFKIEDTPEIDGHQIRLVCEKRSNLLYTESFLYKNNKWMSLNETGRYQGSREYLWDTHDRVLKEYPKYFVEEIGSVAKF